MNEKVESGLEVEVFEARTDDEDGCSMGPVVLKMDYDRVMAEKDAEIQRQHEAHRKTWTQLEQKQRENEQLRTLIAECAEYLNTDRETSIGSGSILHRELLAAMDAKEENGHD